MITSKHQRLNRILIVGSGLAANLTALALRKSLPDTINICILRDSSYCKSDEMYGSISSPEAYAFNLSCNISEPDLLIGTSTSFSFGTHFVNWGTRKKSWMQCFHLPFGSENGVAFHHYMTRHNKNLTDYLISAQAALKGRFAHPPQESKHSLLARAEYAYHFNPNEWSRFMLNKLNAVNVNIIEAGIQFVHAQNGEIQHIDLNNGSVEYADMFIDCSGYPSALLDKLGKEYSLQRKVFVNSTYTSLPQTGPAYRQVRFTSTGWQSNTPLQKGNLSFTIHEQNASDTRDWNEYQLGHCKQAWLGNCVAIGHSAAILEPVTQAPYMLLIRDIKRLLELIPASTDMLVESKEYNRRFTWDYTHAELFHKALYYGERDVQFKYCEKLARKLSQYCHRGVFASFDFEPFNQEDWAILHAGMGRRPKAYDPSADNLGEQKMEYKLAELKNNIGQLTNQMPPNSVYIDKFKQYVQDNLGQHTHG